MPNNLKNEFSYYSRRKIEANLVSACMACTVGIPVSNYLIEEPAVLSIRALFLLKNPLLLCLIRIPNPYFPPF